MSDSGPSAPRPSLARLGPGLLSHCLSCDRLWLPRGSRPAGTRPGRLRHWGSRGIRLPVGSAGPSAAGPPWVQVIRVTPEHGGPPLPLSSSPSAAQSQGEGLKGHKRKSLPSLGTQGLLVLCLSVQGGGPSDASQPWETPRRSSLLHREQVLLSASSVPRGV